MPNTISELPKSIWERKAFYIVFSAQEFGLSYKKFVMFGLLSSTKRCSKDHRYPMHCDRTITRSIHIPSNEENIVLVGQQMQRNIGGNSQFSYFTRNSLTFHEGRLVFEVVGGVGGVVDGVGGHDCACIPGLLLLLRTRVHPTLLVIPLWRVVELPKLPAIHDSKQLSEISVGQFTPGWVQECQLWWLLQATLSQLQRKFDEWRWGKKLWFCNWFPS